MKNFIIALRSLFKKGQHNVMKIISLSIGLTVGLVLIAKVYFEQSYDHFYPDIERIYRVQAEYFRDNKSHNYECTPGGIVLTLQQEIPEIESATRFTSLGENNFTLTDSQKKLKGEIIMGDTCLFDILPRPVLVGNAKEVLAQPMYVLISQTLAENIGGDVVGLTFTVDECPGLTLTIGGVFGDLPENSNAEYDMILSMSSAPQFMWEGSPTNLIGNDRYYSFVKLYPGTQIENIHTQIKTLLDRYFPQSEREKYGIDINYILLPLKDLHADLPSVKRMSWLLALLAFALIFTAIMNYLLIVISAMVERGKMVTIHKCFGASARNIHSMVFSEAFLHILISILIAIGLLFIFRNTVEDLLGTSLGALLLSKGSLFLLLTCVIILLITGLVPGYLYARIPVALAFRNFRERKRNWKLLLLAIQFIAAGFLLSLLAVIGKQYNHMIHDNPGYAYENLAYYNLAGTDSTGRQKVIEEIKRLPEVSGVSSFSQLPFLPVIEISGNNIYLPDSEKELFNIADLYWVSNDYLNVMEIPVIAGEFFTETVNRSHEVMVDRNFVEKMKTVAGWDDNIIGKTIFISEHSQSNDPSELFTICGVYENFRLGTISDQDMRPSLLFYSHEPSDYLAVKFHRLTSEGLQHLQETITNVFPDREIPVNVFSTEITNRYKDSRQFRDSVMIGGIITLLISLIGLAGYVDDEITRRRKELAVRRVNGATVGEIIRIFFRNIMVIAVPSVMVGAAIAYYIAKNWQEQFTEKVMLTLDLFMLAIIVILLVVSISVIYRIYEAAKQNPVNNLRSE